MAIEHATVDQRADGDRLLRGKTDQQVEVEAIDRGKGRRAVDAGRRGMDAERHVELDEPPVEGIELGRIEADAELGADTGAPETELVHGAREFVGRRPRRLHRQRGEAGETLRVALDEGRERVVVPAAECDRRVGVDEVEVGQRIRRQHLEVDARGSIAAIRRSASMNGLLR